jgi:hypothetical protein
MNENIIKTELADLGYGEFFESGRISLKLDAYQAARVIAEHKGAYAVKNVKSEFTAKITGKITEEDGIKKKSSRQIHDTDNCRKYR